MTWTSCVSSESSLGTSVQSSSEHTTCVFGKFSSKFCYCYFAIFTKVSTFMIPCYSPAEELAPGYCTFAAFSYNREYCWLACLIMLSVTASSIKYTSLYRINFICWLAKGIITFWTCGVFCLRVIGYFVLGNTRKGSDFTLKLKNLAKMD